jgi:hypothetical protein
MPAAISIEPENATVYDEIILTFDADLACYQNGTLSGLPYIAMHSGVTINGATWQNVVAFNATGANGQSPVLNVNPDGTFSITFIPFEFYGFPAGAGVTQICAVFNNGSNWNQDGRDFFQGGPSCMDFLIPINTGSPYEPALNSILPNQGIQGETLNVQIFGINTHFVNGSTQIWLSKASNTINTSNYYAVNDTLISATMVIPEDANNGFWTLNVTTPLDGTLFLANCFKINAAGGTMPAAISIYPPDATAYDELTLTFDPTEACFLSGSLIGTSQVFMHSGVSFNTGENWQYVVDFNATGANNQSPELTDNGNSTWSITFTPFEFYGFEPGSVVTQICAVFNDGTWDKDGRDFEDGTTNCADFFIPLNFTTGLEYTAADHFSLGPNPVAEILSVKSPFEIQSYKIYNCYGNCVSQSTLPYTKSFTADVRNLSRGIYFISIEGQSGWILTQKFIKN